MGRASGTIVQVVGEGWRKTAVVADSLAGNIWLVQFDPYVAADDAGDENHAPRSTVD